MSGQNKVEYDLLESNVNNIDTYSDEVNTALQTLNRMIQANVNSGAGIYDGAYARDYKDNYWDPFAAKFHSFYEMCKASSTNLRGEIDRMRRVDTSGVTGIDSN